MIDSLRTASASAIALAVALVAATNPALAQTATPPDANTSEIVVTAQKRSEPLHLVPTAVTVVSATQLQSNGQITARDLVGSVPGLQVSGSLGSGAFVIRGISSGQDLNPTVATLIDGVPIGPVTSGAVGAPFMPELDPSILQQIEVLRGPQGTLYGAATLGGIVNYITQKPSLTKVTGSLYGEDYGTDHGDNSYTLRGALSVPLVQGKLALQMSGFDNRLGGYIDASQHDDAKFDYHRSQGARVALLWQPTPDFHIQLSGIYSNLDSRNDSVTYNASTATPVAGGLNYTQFAYPDYNSRFKMGSINAEYDLHGAVLSYIGSYQKQRNFSSLDYATGALTPIIGILPLVGGVTLPADSHIGVPQRQTSEKTTQELRLTSSGDTPLRWLAGLFYNHERSDFLENIGSYDGADRPSAPPLGNLLQYNNSTHLSEYAAFGNITYYITPKLDITGGVRVERVVQDYRSLFGGPDSAPLNIIFGTVGYLPTPADSGKSTSRETVVNYLFNARYRFNQRVMTYFRFATGYRPGGPNLLVPGLQRTYKADQTYDYEVGLKASLWADKAYIDLNAFYIDWRNIQVLTAFSGLNGLTNGGGATSKGIEASLNLQPVHRLIFNATLTYTDARLNDDIPYAPEGLADGQGAAGDRLPSSPKWSASISADYSWPWFDNWEGLAGGLVRYVGNRESVFAHSVVYTPYLLPSYVVGNVRVGVRKNGLELTAFARNIGDKRAQIGVYTTGGTDVVVARPRSYGLSASYKF